MMPASYGTGENACLSQKVRKQEENRILPLTLDPEQATVDGWAHFHPTFFSFFHILSSTYMRMLEFIHKHPFNIITSIFFYGIKLPHFN
jgi:hypothetical protein